VKSHTSTARRGRTALSLFFALVLTLGCTAKPTARTPLVEAAPRVILISFDGFRWDYINRPGAVRLRELAARGARLERLVPVFPSKTFPNHYSIVTGLTAEHHGIVANSMRDSLLGSFTQRDTIAQNAARWWGGEPIWVTAEKQGRRAAVVGWPGSEAAIGGVRPSWWSRYWHEQPHAEKVQKILDWLSLPADSAPNLMVAYFHDVDGAGHSFGPDAAQVDSAIAMVDKALGALIDGIAARGLTDAVNIIVVSDHGMTPVSPERAIVLDDYISLSDVDVIDWTPVSAIAPKPGATERVYARLKDAHPQMAVYRRGELPARYHFNDNPRITEIVAVAAPGWTIASRAQVNRWRENNWRGGGNHGFDPDIRDMGALFVAAGPGIAEGRQLTPRRNVHVYALMAHLLRLTPARTDGSLDSMRAVLRETSSARR
jgi:predicted AlkP superfamily pyrophosphatase or phosphodiesterase